MSGQTDRRTLSFRKEFFEDLGILPPVLIDLHAECEKYPFPEYIFENETRFCTDILDFLPSLPDDDDLLRIGFDIHIRLDLHEIRILILDLRDFDIGSIRDLITELMEELLTDDLRDPELR